MTRLVLMVLFAAAWTAYGFLKNDQTIANIWIVGIFLLGAIEERNRDRR